MKINMTETLRNRIADDVWAWAEEAGKGDPSYAMIAGVAATAGAIIALKALEQEPDENPKKD